MQVTRGYRKPLVTLVTLVNDSEYSKSTGAKPTFRILLAVFISFPWRAVRPYPTPSSFFGEGSTKKKQKKENRGRGRGGGGVMFRWRVWCANGLLEIGEEPQSAACYGGDQGTPQIYLCDCIQYFFASVFCNRYRSRSQ